MPKKKQQPAALSMEEMQQRLAEIELDREKLEVALKQRRWADLVEFAETLRGQIAERGYQIEEVIALLQKKGKGSGRRRGNGQPHFVDPDDPSLTYRRGPLPAWLREKMEAAGYDPTDKAQRDAFKSTFLTQVG
jgi:DNA-binding protein H-NS